MGLYFIASVAYSIEMLWTIIGIIVWVFFDSWFGIKESSVGEAIKILAIIPFGLLAYFSQKAFTIIPKLRMTRFKKKNEMCMIYLANLFYFLAFGILSILVLLAGESDKSTNKTIFGIVYLALGCIIPTIILFFAQLSFHEAFGDQQDEG